MYQFSKEEMFAILIISYVDFNGDSLKAIDKFLERHCTEEEYCDFCNKVISYRKCWVQTKMNIKRLKWEDVK